MPEIIWKRGAEDDLLRVFAALEESGVGRGERFTLALDEVLQNLKTYPRMAPVYVATVRRLVIGNSGFGIFYSCEDRGLIVHALVHLRENPESIREKIRRLLGL